MMRRTSSSGVAEVKSSMTGSARSTPQLTPSSSHSVFATQLAATPIFADPYNDRRSISPPPLHVVPATGNSLADDAVAESKKKKKEKDREKREKRGRPQNALLNLAGISCGGVTPSSNVVDLRALDPVPLQNAGRRSNRSTFESVPPTKILDFLYLGSVKDAQDPSFLAKHNIRYIINVSQEEYWSVDKRVQIFTFKVDDSATADIASLFEPTRSLINSVRDRYYRNEVEGRSSRPAVLVHCQKGRSRSATIVLAYLIYTNGWSVAEAMKYVASRRPCAEPNIGFMEELRKLQESLTAEERTKRYSELCWFMRNLDAQTSEWQVREMFEQRVGLVRDVVMLAAPPNKSDDGGAAVNRGGGAKAALYYSGNSAHDTPLVTFPMTEEEEGGAGAANVSQETQNDSGAGDASRSAADPAAELEESPSSPVSSRRSAMCFVFLACREDILRGIKCGQLREILQHLRSVPGKQIKFATGPKLRRLMMEHQSMSASFASDMAQFSEHVRQRAGDGASAGSDDPTVETQSNGAGDNASY